MSKFINYKKLRKVSNQLGTECGELTVKIFHGTITPEEARKIQEKHCSRILRNNGLVFTKEVYKTVYSIITVININRQKKHHKPIAFYTTGMDEFFKRLGIVNPYN